MALRLELHYPRVALSKNTVHLALAEAVYQKMAAAGIWTDADSKNRILADTLAALELVSIGLTKVIADANTVEDTLVHRVTKGLFDTVAQAETFKFELTQVLTDTTTAHEEFQFDLICHVYRWRNGSPIVCLLKETFLYRRSSSLISLRHYLLMTPPVSACC